MDKGKDGLIGQVVRARHQLLKTMREFFYARGYTEVETPCLMRTAPPDPYIEPLKVFVGESGPYYLHTSPEMGMKKLLSTGCEKIFQICKTFREEEFEEHHAIEFTMAEWYLKGTYERAMDETTELISFVSSAMDRAGREYLTRPWKVYELKQLLLETAGIDPFPLTRDQLLSAMEQHGFRGLKGADTWEDLFFKLFIQEVEPAIQDQGPYFIKDWPASITAMAKRKDAHTVERFELYMKGLEIANGYTELLDPDEQRERLSRDSRARTRLGKTGFAPDEQFLRALSLIDGPVAGVSVGVDRLLMVLLGKEKIDQVLVDRFTL